MLSVDVINNGSNNHVRYWPAINSKLFVFNQ